MAMNATVLFDLPQHEIASAIQAKLRAATKTWIVTGFMTVEGVRLLESALLAQPGATQAIVIGAGTYQAFEAIERLIAAGVPRDRLWVHLGHTRLTGGSARHRFYRYHPMLHSKVYYMEHGDGTASAFVGSHNVTGFALAGLNGEAAVLLEGPQDSPEFEKIRNHIQHAIRESVHYTPGMKPAFAWWTHQFIQGLADKANDLPREGEAKKTIVILAELTGARHPRKGDIVYFELPLALGTINSLNAEVHIYLFDHLPPSPEAGLRALHTARISLWCRTRGLEMERGGVELQADWHIADHRRPVLQAVVPPFRPRRGPNVQQVRVQAYNEVRGEWEYLFEAPSAAWVPVIDRNQILRADENSASILAQEYRRPNPESYDWYLVTGLQGDGEGDDESGYAKALVELSPESGSYVMMSLRRREVTKRKMEEDEDEDEDGEK